jgi:hypothetical protein
MMLLDGAILTLFHARCEVVARNPLVRCLQLMRFAEKNCDEVWAVRLAVLQAINAVLEEDFLLLQRLLTCLELCVCKKERKKEASKLEKSTE